MQELLVFTHSELPRCISYHKDCLILITDASLCLFNLGQSKVLSRYLFLEQVMPISMWVLEEDQTAVVQGKMGWNFVFRVQPSGPIQFVRKYRTQVYGFCHMLRHENSLLAISEQERAVLFYEIGSGQLLLKNVLENQKCSQSITCLQLRTNADKMMAVYAAQEGNAIHKLSITAGLEDSDDRIAEVSESLHLPKEQEINIINSMIIEQDTMYSLVRKCRWLYILRLDPKMQLMQSIDFQFVAPRHLNLVIPAPSSKRSFVLTDGNRIMRIWPSDGKIATIGQLNQSKSIGYLQLSNGILIGCTEQKQFFYLDSMQ